MRVLDRTGLNHNDLHHNNMLMRDGEPNQMGKEEKSIMYYIINMYNRYLYVVLIDRMMQNACET